MNSHTIKREKPPSTPPSNYPTNTVSHFMTYLLFSMLFACMLLLTNRRKEVKEACILYSMNNDEKKALNEFLIKLSYNYDVISYQMNTNIKLK